MIDTELPERGVGFLTFNRSESTHWGTKEAIDAILAVGKAWQFSVPFSIGHISRKGGGKFPPHKTHQTGLDFDVRPLRKDGRNAPVNISSTQYDRALTLSLIKLFRKVCDVERLFFNDPQSVWEGLSSHVDGHADHFHVRLRAREILKLGSKGEAVKALQRKLGVEVDGVFGRNTEAAVKGYQQKHGFAQTGQVDQSVWAALEDK